VKRFLVAMFFVAVVFLFGCHRSSYGHKLGPENTNSDAGIVVWEHPKSPN
jgi:hypothetical protein